MKINGEEIDTFADTDGITNKKTLIITHVSFRNLNVTLKLCSDFLKTAIKSHRLQYELFSKSKCSMLSSYVYSVIFLLYIKKCLICF